jgi:hypothetical protein
VAGDFHISRSLGGAYVISEPLLRRCLRLVEEFSGKDTQVNFSISFTDGRTLDGNPDAILGDSLIQSTSIRDIIISQSAASDQVYINFRGYGDVPIYLKADGSKSSLINFETELLNELSGGKQWYSLLVRSELKIMVASILSGAFLSGAFITQLNLHLSGLHNTALDKILLAIAVPLSIFIICLIAFPPLIFDLGHGARRHRVRTTILSFLVVTLFGGIVVNFSSDWLKEYFSPRAKEVDREKSVAEPRAMIAPQVPAPPPPVVNQHTPFAADLKEQTNQDIRQSAYVLSQELTELLRQYYRDQENIAGSVDQVASAKLELDEKLNRDFRQQYEPDMLKLDVELARRLSINDHNFTSFPSGLIGAGAIGNFSDHLVRLANQLP